MKRSYPQLDSGVPAYKFALKALALIYVVAFGSLIFQIDGLIGSSGILPAAPIFSELSKSKSILELPSLLLLMPNDFTLYICCILGIGCGLLLLFDIASTLATFSCWILYLSMVYAGQVFTGYQWDILLVEFGFLAVLISVWLKLPGGLERATKIISYCIEFSICFLLFKLMLCSGVVKILGGGSWHDMTALKYHFFTQPIPGPLSYYFHTLPEYLLEFLCALTFYLELIVPLALLIPHLGFRRLAALQIALFQIAIFLSGNFAFFNCLTIAICIPIIFREPLTFLHRPQPTFWNTNIKKIIGLAIISTTVALVPLNIHIIFKTCRLDAVLPEILVQAFKSSMQITASYSESIRPFMLANSYGLFARMTTERPELQIQASLDGTEWKDYSFKYKINHENHLALQVAPHQPRLDWQMWFAALRGKFPTQGWMHNFVFRLLQQEKSVIQLMEANPFDQKPRFIRILLYHYEYLRPSDKEAKDRFWTRKLKGVYLAPVSLQ